MATDKNLHIPEELMAQLEAAAQVQGKTPDQLGEEMIRQNLDFVQLLAAGHEHAAARGFKRSDVLPKIAHYRREKSERGR